MGKVVAIITVFAAWFALCPQASQAFGMVAGPLAGISPDGREYPFVSVNTNAPVSFQGMADLSGVRDVLLSSDTGVAGPRGENVWGDTFFFLMGAELFNGSSRKGGRLIYSIDPHTMCVSVLCNSHGALVREEWTATDGFFPGSRPSQARSTSSGSQSGFMAVAGLTMIGLSGLRRNRGARAAVRIYRAQEHSQPWKTRIWKDYSVKKEPTYQTRAA